MFVVRIYVEGIGDCWLAEDDHVVYMEKYAKTFNCEEEAKRAAALWDDMARIEECL